LYPLSADVEKLPLASSEDDDAEVEEEQGDEEFVLFSLHFNSAVWESMGSGEE